MSEANTSNQNVHPADKRGVITHTFGFIFRIIGVLLFSAFISILVEWAGMAWWHSDEYQGYQHAKQMFHTEMGYLNSSVEGGAIESAAAIKANEYVKATINFVLIDSGFAGWIKQSYVVMPNDNDVVAFLKGIQSNIYDYLIAMLYTLMTFTVRVSILVLSLPLFLVFGIIGFVDGLMQRDIRRFTGEHESSFVYHIAKGFAVPFIVMSWIFYLAMPVSVHPNWIVTPFAALFAYAVYIATSKFKKYL